MIDFLESWIQMKNVFLSVSIVFLILGIIFILKGVYHFLPMMREIRHDKEAISNVFGFLIFFIPKAFTSQGNYHRTRFLFGISVGTLCLVTSFFLSSLAK